MLPLVKKLIPAERHDSDKKYYMAISSKIISCRHDTHSKEMLLDAGVAKIDVEDTSQRNERALRDSMCKSH